MLEIVAENYSQVYPKSAYFGGEVLSSAERKRNTEARISQGNLFGLYRGHFELQFTFIIEFGRTCEELVTLAVHRGRLCRVFFVSKGVHTIRERFPASAGSFR